MSLAADSLYLHLRHVTREGTSPPCSNGSGFDGRLGLRVAAIFIIWICSSIGSCFPIFAKRHKGLHFPEWPFFVAKYFGSGVILATAFIHLLAPAHEALNNKCLDGPITEYAWVEGIVMMTIFVLFFVELMVMRSVRAQRRDRTDKKSNASSSDYGDEIEFQERNFKDTFIAIESHSDPRPPSANILDRDHIGHDRDHNEHASAGSPFPVGDCATKMTAIFILEFGIIFHSVFIGLTLAVSGPEFMTLFPVLVFHQTFEGLGLGSRLAAISWDARKRWAPYILALIYGISTPIAIAIGLGLRNIYPPESATTLIVNGVFDSISAGILIYAGIVELMAHEFMYSSEMKEARIAVVLAAFGTMSLGAALMALLGKWA